MKKKTIISIITIIVLVFVSILTAKIVHYNVMKKKKGLYEEKISYFIDNVKKYKEDKVSKDSIIVKLTLKDLISNNYVEEYQYDPLHNEFFKDDLAFCIINNNGEYEYLIDDGKNCGETIIELINTPKEAYNDYLYTQVAYVDFSNLEGLEYYIKSTRDAVSNTNINYMCNKGDAPSSCRSIKSTKTIKADYWYKVSGDIEITYDEHSDSVSFIYALVTDDVEYKNTTSEIIDKIDRTSPVVVLDTPVSSTNSISVKIKDMLDNETGVASSVCRYGTTEDEYKTISMSNTRGKLSRCIINYKLKDKVYYYQVCATDEVGNVGCSKGNSLIESVNNPIATYLDNEIKIDFNNKKNKNLTYYIKSTKEVTLEDETISYCDKGILPDECIKSEVAKLKPNIWYQVSSKTNINYKDSDFIIYAVIYSSEEYATSTTFVIK